MHDTQFQKRSMLWKLPRFALASALLIAGFSGGERLAKMLYPKTPATSGSINAFSADAVSRINFVQPKPSVTPPVASIPPSPALTALNGLFNANEREHRAV